MLHVSGLSFLAVSATYNSRSIVNQESAKVTHLVYVLNKSINNLPADVSTII